MSRIRQYIYRWTPPIAWMAAIFWFSNQPNLPGLPNSLADLILKIGLHMTAYAILTILLFRSMQSQGLSDRPALLSAALVALLYAMSDEWHQHFVPGRHGQPLDVLIDSVGITTIVLLLRFHRLRRSRLPSRHPPRAR